MNYQSVQEMFSRTADEFARHVAIERDRRAITYAELESQSNRLANFLRDDGAAKGSMIALFTDDPIQIIGGILAVLKAGAVFVPLDPAFPDQRLQVMIEQVRPRWFVTESRHLEKLARLQQHAATQARLICVNDFDTSDFALYDNCKHPALASDPDAPCSIYFTSGSTGKPKAILGRLKGIAHFINWEIDAVHAGQGTRVTQLTSPSFDGFLKDAFVPLCSGGVVCAPPSREIILDASRLIEWLDAEQIEVLHCVPSVFRALINEKPARNYFETMKYVVLTGEPLYPADVQRWMELLGERVKLLNIYGTTETTLSKFHYEVQPEDVKRPSIPVGKPMEGTEVLLLNSRGALCGPWAVGEIHIRTPYRSHGYYGEPHLTSEVFIKNPFSDDPEDIIYKTGDFGRLLDDGDLEHLGRRDQQVQVRGVRVELGEIENLLRAHEAIADVAVIDRDDADGNKFLIAYLTMNNGDGTDALRQYLAERLPNTMLPSAFIQLDQLPRTLNGKIDRKALPALDEILAKREAENTMSPMEEIIAGIWCDVLRLSRVRTTDNFFNLGGHSLSAMQAALRAKELLKLDISVRHMFELPTVAQLAQFVQQQIAAAGPREETPIEIVSRDEELPASFAQQRLWFTEEFSKSTAFHIHFQVRLHGLLNRAALEQAFGEVIRRHEILRTSFPGNNGQPAQVIHAFEPFELPSVDLRGLNPEERELTQRVLEKSQLTPSFDLAHGPLTRLTLLQNSGDDHTVLCTLHHIISDGWSNGLLVREISTLYDAFCKGRPSSLDELPIQYADFAVWQRRELEGAVLEQDLNYWRDQLADAPPTLQLATDRPRPAVQTYNGAAEPFTLSKETSEKLRTLSQRNGVTLFMTLLAAFITLLHRYTSQDDLVVGTTVANRERPEIENLVGFFVNMLALRADCSANPRFDELLQQMRETTLKAFLHQRLPFEMIVEELQPQRNLSYAPLFQVIFSFQNQPTLTDLTLAGLTLSCSRPEMTTSQCDLLMDMSESNGVLSGGLQYNSDLFDERTAVSMVGHFQNLLEGIAADPKQRLSELPLLAEVEKTHTIVEWNRTEREYPRDTCVHQLFELVAAEAPDSIAAVFKEEHLSYAELNRRANRVARHLRAQGVEVGDLVGIGFERSLEELAVLLGVLKAGAGYLPIDPDTPPHRVSFMLADADVGIVLTQQNLSFTAANDANLNVAIPSESAAYVIYTSGSTGEPKGTTISHAALVNYICWARDVYLQGDSLNFPLYSSLAFDLTATSIFVPLISGNRVTIYGAERNLAPLVYVMEENRCEIVKLTPAHLSLIKERDHRQSTIRRLIVGGEALTTQLAAETYASFDGVEIFNEYGPTEATVGCMIYKFDPAVDTGSVVPVGQPAANTQICVLDRGLSPVAENMIGEIYIAGDGLAEGYRNRFELTAERFLPNPFGSGRRMYRTGDLARRLPMGALEFVGRIDDQLKVRGFRIEPGEIEAALVAHPEITQAVVVAREDQRGEKVLVAYVVPGAGDQLAIQDVRQQLAQQLPAYMVPATIVPLTALPLTANGKLNRRALPEPEFSSAVWRAPRTPQEEILCALFTEVLGVAEVGIDDNFFELGGHSLLATRLASLVRATLGVELSIRELFESPTVAQLAIRLRRAGESRRPPLRPQPRPERLPLSYAQQRLWFIDQLEGSSTEYNMAMALHLRGALQPEQLHEAINLLVARHESLRTHFAQHDGAPVQVILPELAIDLPLEDLSGLADSARHERVQACLAQEANEPFDLSRGPLLRLRLLKLATDEHLLLRTLHHIVSDGWSEAVFSRELIVLYEALGEGRTDPLPPLTAQYADFALWQREWLASEVSGGLDYWRKQLAGIPERLELPTDRPRPPLQTFAAELCQLRLTPEQTAALKQLSRKQQATLYMTLLALYALLLERYSGQDDIVIGSPIANRQEPQLESLIGFFVNMLCFRVRLEPQLSFTDLLAQVRATALEAYEYQDVPFERLVEELAPQRSLNTTPIFQVGFALQNEPKVTERVRGLVIDSITGEELRVGHDLEVQAREEQGALKLTWLYNRDLFDRLRIEQMAQHYVRLVDAVLSDPEQHLGSIDLLNEEEEQRLVQEWNETIVPLPAATLAEMFEAQVERTPEAIAVIFENESLTYAALNQRANQLAHHLRTLNVNANVPVAILLDRGPQMLVAMIATLKAGGAYVPLDQNYPRDRVSFMMEDSGAAVLITKQSLAEQASAIAQQSEANPTRQLGPEDLSYIMYTSGSTGRPKGVLIEQGSSVNFIHWAHQTFTRDEFSGVLASTSICFDLSVFEIFAPLTCGGTVILAHDALHLATHAAADCVTLINTVPSAMTELLQMRAIGPNVRTFTSGGEALKNPLVPQVFAGTNVRRVLNVYGPTEYTTYATSSELKDGDWQDVPIGEPVTNTVVHIVDRSLRPVPFGTVGEICIGGRGLARGYLNRPEITAERFIPDGLSGELGARLFRTGDLGQQLANGERVYLGRIDDQLKVRGFRIEPGEIEAALVAHPEITQAVVVAREDQRGEKVLVAYVVPAPGYQLDVQDVRQQLAQQLPAYMVPATIVPLAALPLTANGKLNRRALPEPEFSSAVWRAPRTPQEEILCALFTEVLGVAEVGIDDNFFELGGHSLLATRLASLVRATLGVELSIRELFESPTVAQLAIRLRRAGESRRPPLRPQPRPERLPLSYAQQRLWFIDQLEGSSTEYNMAMALHLRGVLQPEQLREAINLLVTRHESLRTHFAQHDGAPVQVILPELAIDLPLEDLSGLAESARQERVQACLAREANEPFDLSRGPLLRLRLLKLATDEHLLLRTLHHIVSDGWSESVFSRELIVLYEALGEGRGEPLPPLTAQYADFALWQRQWLASEVSGGLDYWRKQLAGIPERLELPTDRPRPPLQTFAAELCQLRLTPEQTAALKQLSRKQQATLYMTLLALYALLLERYSGQDDIVIGSPIANRQEPQLESLIGFFVNMLCFRVRLEPQLSFTDLLAQVRATALEAYEYQDVPFERLVEELAPQRSLNTTPIFQVGFALQNEPKVTERVRGLVIDSITGEELRVRHDLEVQAREEQGALKLTWLYNRDLFDRRRIEQMAQHYVRLVDAVLSDPEQHLGSIALLVETEREQIVERWNDTAVPLAATTLPELFEAQVERTPDAIAVAFEDEFLTYAALNQRANQLAHHLMAQRIGPEDRVALTLQTSPELLISILGILKSGAAYLPIDTEYPTARVEFMLADAAPAAVLSDREAIRKFVQTADHNPSDHERTAPLRPQHPAYVIYTSGSTGTPKGVVIAQPGVQSLIHTLQSKTGVAPGDRCSLWTTVSFDASVFEMFSALLSGATLCLPDRDIRTDADAFLRWLIAESITHAHIPAFMLPALAHASHWSKTQLKRLVVGAEPISAAALHALHRTRPDLHILNGYGPTEITVAATFYSIPREAGVTSGGIAPIGTPVQNTQAYVLDNALNPLPVGVAGELYIGGAGLARGYLQRPELTAERFIPNPFGEPGTRLYRTGDRVHWRTDGNLEFIGRVDAQLKLRGFRIEPGEIEVTLRQHPALRDALVVARPEPGGDKRLVAYVVPHQLQPAELQLEAQTEQVQQWQSLFDEVQAHTQDEVDPSFDIRGWNSSYTGQPIPAKEMREWRDATVERILSLQPKRVLEIGCGTGLLLLPIAPQCSLYVGTDFSSITLARLQRKLTDLPQVRLLERTADNLEELEAEALDTVIINSVSQYFPSIGYLLSVLSGAVSAVADGGAVFIGDVRNFSLLNAFHAAVLLHRADARLTKAQFAEQLQRAVQAEKELLIDPAFFTDVLPQRFRRIKRIEVQLKHGRYHNELNQFRYDVTLHVGSAMETTENADKTQCLDWQEDGVTLSSIKTLLDHSTHPSFRIANVPNARLHSANQILGWLNTHEPDTVGDFRAARAASAADEAIDPQQLFELNLDYQMSLSWSTGDPEGRFDVLLHRRGTPAPAHRRATDSRPFSTYANTPLQTHLQRHLVIDLRRFLQQRLPDYMVPSTFMVLPKWPTSNTGKIDRRALPAPDQTRPELDQHYVAPRSAIEEVLAALWANVLNLDRVGIHDNFFDLGGHSLLATQLISRARNLFQSELQLRWIFDASTVATFAETLVAHEPRPGQTEKIAATFLKVKAMKLQSSKSVGVAAHP